MFVRFNKWLQPVALIGLALIGIAAVAVGIGYVGLQSIGGRAASPLDLPRFAEAFPEEFRMTNLRYSYDPWTHRLLLSGKATDADVSKLLERWKFSSIQYSNWNGKMDYAIDDPAFLPSPGNVKIGFGKLPNTGRLNTWVYYKPTDSGDDGSLFIHFL